MLNENMFYNIRKKFGGNKNRTTFVSDSNKQFSNI